MHGKGEHATLCSDQLDHIIMRSHSHLDDEKSEKSNSCLMALVVTFHGIAPCYAILELLFFS